MKDEEEIKVEGDVHMLENDGATIQRKKKWNKIIQELEPSTI